MLILFIHCQLISHQKYFSVYHLITRSPRSKSLDARKLIFVNAKYLEVIPLGDSVAALVSGTRALEAVTRSRVWDRGRGIICKDTLSHIINNNRPLTVPLRPVTATAGRDL